VTLTQKPAPSPTFSVVAIMAGFNEADIIGQVVGNLIDEGVRVYYLDDGSTDGTEDVVAQYLHRGVLGIERLSDTLADNRPEAFQWERILRRKSELAEELEADWFIHHDADEFRESPWPGCSLKDGIRAVDSLGFNAIDFLCLNFWATHDRFQPGDDPRDVFTYYEPAAVYDQVRINCWKKTGQPVDLTSSGGHEARFDGRIVFPVEFLLRHYPLRGQCHGERKVFRERQPRFRDEERARGWHVQYSDVQEGASFIRDSQTLISYDQKAVKLELLLNHRGVAATSQALQATSAALESTRSEIADLRAALAAAEQEAAVRRAALADKEQHVARLQASVAEKDRWLDDVHRSRSWRWTLPARALVRLIRGR
jgi:glycosyltransferase involved in cell wall biosynthesis